jgi:hypothetical protein
MLTRGVIFIAIAGISCASLCGQNGSVSTAGCSSQRIPKLSQPEAIATAQRFLDQHKINMSGEALKFAEYKTSLIEYVPSFWELTWTGRRRIVLLVFQDGLCIMPSASNQSMQPTASPRTASVSDD